MMKVFFIAANTYRQATRQPLFYIMVLSMGAITYVSQYFTLFCFYEETNMIREVALASVMICGLLVSVIGSSLVVTEEIEKLTAMTILSKPVSKWQFLGGKYVGISAAAFAACIFIGEVAILTLWVKDGLPLLDSAADVSNYSRNGAGIHQLVMEQFPRDYVWPLVTGGLLAFGQVVILTGFCVSVAAHVPLVVTAASCFLIFVLGHLSAYIWAVFSKSGGLLKALGAVLYAVLPNLENFNAGTRVAAGQAVSMKLLAFAWVYAILYSCAVFLLGGAAFKLREVK
jgi:hypothetical protein